jgi:D-alanine-D-alanine ligase
LYNAPVLDRQHTDSVSEADVIEAATAVRESLRREGLSAEMLPVGPPLCSVVKDLEHLAPDVVFNLIEGFGGRSTGATNFTGLIELLGLPMTGSSAEALALCQSKSRTKALLRGFGLPTAPSLVIEPGQPQPLPRWDGPWPVFVKPDAEDASLGIDQASVIDNPEALDARVKQLLDAYGPVLIETYLPGPEFNLGIITLSEPEVLPVSEVIYQQELGLWPILTYSAKWLPDSIEDKASTIRCPAQVEPALAERLRSLALAAIAATRCRDYARVDFRLDARGEPMILEVNPNPDISPDVGWARALKVSGRSYDQTIAALARQAWKRSR